MVQCIMQENQNRLSHDVPKWSPTPVLGALKQGWLLDSTHTLPLGQFVPFCPFFVVELGCWPHREECKYSGLQCLVNPGVAEITMTKNPWFSFEGEDNIQSLEIHRMFKIKMVRCVYRLWPRTRGCMFTSLVTWKNTEQFLICALTHKLAYLSPSA